MPKEVQKHFISADDKFYWLSLLSYGLANYQAHTGTLWIQSIKTPTGCYTVMFGKWHYFNSRNWLWKESDISGRRISQQLTTLVLLLVLLLVSLSHYVCFVGGGHALIDCLVSCSESEPKTITHPMYVLLYRMLFLYDLGLKRTDLISLNFILANFVPD